MYQIKTMKAKSVDELKQLRYRLVLQAMKLGFVIAAASGPVFIDDIYDAMNTYITALINMKTVKNHK